MAIYSPTNIQTEQQNDFVGVQNLSTTFKHNFEAQKQLFAQEIRVHYNLREPKGNKPTMVFLVVYINKKQIRISTGCKVYPKQWNSTRAITGITLTKLDNCNNRILNAKIDELNTRFEEYKYYICNGFAELNIKSFKSYMENKVLNQPKDKSIDIIKVMKESITKDYNIKIVLGQITFVLSENLKRFIMIETRWRN